MKDLVMFNPIATLGVLACLAIIASRGFAYGKLWWTARGIRNPERDRFRKAFR